MGSRRFMTFGPDAKGHRLRTTALVATTLFVAVSVLTPSAAGAKIYERGTYDGTDSYSYDCEGYTVEVAVEFQGRYHIRQGKGRLDSAFFFHDKFWYSEVHSANDKFFTVTGNALFHETRAIPLGGNLFEFHAIEAGQPFVVRDMDGNVLVRDRGVIRYAVVFDTLGDEEPGGVFVEEVSTEFGGPHSRHLLGPDDGCALLAPTAT